MRFDSGLHARAGEIAGYPWIDEWVDQVRFCEDAGFTGVWVAEHHFFWDGWVTPTPTNPLHMGAFLAGQTDRLRIGQCGVAINDYHPIRVAEDAAMLDHMTRGRMEFGFMRGLNSRVNGNFNRDADRRDTRRATALMWENLDIILKAWTGEPFSHKGEFHEIPMPGWHDDLPPEGLDPRYYAPDGELKQLAVRPTPYQRPHPPLWVMGDSIESHRSAAERGINVVCWGRSFEATREVWTAYRDAAREAGKNGTVAMMRTVFVAPTMEEAERIVRPALNELFAHMTPSKNAAWSRKGFLASGEELTQEDIDCDWFDFLMRREWALVGTPDFVAERIAKYQEELGADHLIQYWAVANVKPRELRASQELFASQVMPRFERQLVRG